MELKTHLRVGEDDPGPGHDHDEPDPDLAG